MARGPSVRGFEGSCLFWSSLITLLLHVSSVCFNIHRALQLA